MENLPGIIYNTVIAGREEAEGLKRIPPPVFSSQEHSSSAAARPGRVPSKYDFK